MTRMLAKLWKRLSRPRRRQFIILLVLMLVASFTEVVSIGAILPFLGVLTAPEKVMSYPALQPFFTWLRVEEARQLLLPLTLLFITAALIASSIRILLAYATTRYSYALGADISIDVYRRTLYQPYPMHTTRNSSETINAITGKTAMVIGSVFVPLMTLASAAMILAGVILALVAVDPMITLVAGVLFGGIYRIIVGISKRKLRESSECVARESTQVIKSLQEGLGGIRDVLLDGTQELYCQIYRSADRPLRQAQGNINFLSSSPRYLIETLGLVLVSVLAYSMSQRPGGVVTAIPVLGALALGAQRLLPVLQQGYSSYVIMRGAEASLRDALALMDQPLPDLVGNALKKPLSFASKIELKQIGFRYGPKLPWVLRGIDLVIRRGSRVGFIGTTGIGKSTLFDVIMGLLPPTEGSLAIDGIMVVPHNQSAWQAHLAHVPQNVYLADTSIAENIAFGVPHDSIDLDRVKEAARGAQIAQTIESLPEQYLTAVGERGARLSGGQRQRIGIARALYKNADVIILDEATSSLDERTEHSILNMIYDLGRGITILIISHRTSSLQGCDKIFQLNAGGIRLTRPCKEQKVKDRSKEYQC